MEPGSRLVRSDTVTISSGTSVHTQVRLTGGLPVRFARRGAPAPGEPVPSPASTPTAGRTARTRLNVDDAWCEALFASALQRSAAPAADTGPAAPAAPRGQRTAARGRPRPGHPPGPAGHCTRRTEDAI